MRSRSFCSGEKEYQARCVEAHTPNLTPQDTPPQEPEKKWSLVRFELSVSSLPEAARVGLGDGCAKVVGNRPELGEWNVDQGMRLVSAEDVLVAEVLVERGNRIQICVCR
ncbi:hypothetical protein FGB62_37g113 [Gracilaria domingensis]|nr:hypothetical protein FGB62_37g113 [Gracilaria domingensis]